MSGRRRHEGVLGLGRAGWIGLFVVGFLLTCASAATAWWSVQVNLASSSWAIAKAGSLLPPTTPTATANGSNAVTVSWVPAAGQVTGARYQVMRTSPGGAQVVCTVVPTTTSCQDAGLAAGTTYAYSVVAVIGDSWRSAAVTVSATTLGVTTTSLPSGSVGAAYSASLAAVGGSGAYTWTLSSGTLPGWATLNASTGQISGTPTSLSATSGLVFRVADSRGSATSGSLTLTVGQGSTTTTVTPSMTSVTYGAESAATFAVAVRTADNASVASGSVTVKVGSSATCTVTLPASSCSLGNTDLPAGGPYAITATFVGNADLAGSSGRAETGLTVEPDSATVTAFAVTGSATYGAETGLVFTASVSGTNAAIPNERTVAVTSGPTTLCTITLSSGTGSCSPTSATLLPAGSYIVTATFNAAGGDPNFVTTAFRDAPLIINPATATVALTVSPASVVFGEETSLVFTASVTAAPAVIPAGATVAVTAAGGAPVCTIVALTSGTGSCSPTSGTVLPLGVNSVMATFNAGEPNFTTATSTTTVTVTASPFAGIEWVSVTTTGTFSCNTTAPRAVTCTAAGVGNRGTFQAGVQLVDATRSPFLNATGAPITVAQITTGGGGTTTTSGLVTIAPSTSATPGTFLLTLNPGQPPATTITASVTINQITYTVNCVVTR